MKSSEQRELLDFTSPAGALGLVASSPCLATARSAHVAPLLGTHGEMWGQQPGD